MAIERPEDASSQSTNETETDRNKVEADPKIMRELLDYTLQEVRALEGREFPMGAMVVGPDGQIISRAVNQTNTRQSSLAHAEILAVEDAMRARGSKHLDGCVLYSTHEPCTMCSGALHHSNIAGLVYSIGHEEFSREWTDEVRVGGERKKMRTAPEFAAGNILSRISPETTVISGYMHDEAIRVLHGDMVKARMARDVLELSDEPKPAVRKENWEKHEERLALVTSNPNKAREFGSILGERFDVENVSLELHEPQDFDVENVVRIKAQAAYNVLRKPVLVEDTALCFSALGDRPGAMVKAFLETLGSDGLARMIQEKDRSAISRTAVAYFDGTDMKVFIGETRGTISIKPKGSAGFGWDDIFIPEGENRTFAEMSLEEKNDHSSRKKAIDAMQEGITL